MSKQTSLGLFTVTAGVAAALVALLLFAGQVFAAGSVSVSDASVPAGGGAATVTVTGTAGAGAGIGNYTVSVSFDPLDFTGAPTCTSNAAGSCQVNPGGSSGIVRFAGASGDPAGLTGDVALGTITFNAGAAFTGCTSLSVDATTAPNRFDNQDGTALGPTVSGGEVCATVVTASPTPAPATPTPVPGSTTPAATATKTAGALPNTGGTPGTDTGSTATLLLAVSGLMIVAGGAWAVARARREI